MRLALDRRPVAPRVPGRPPAWQRRLRRHRRVLAAVLAAVVVASLASSLRPADPPQEHVLVAAHDLLPGAALAPGDLAPASRPSDAIPVDAVAAEGSTGRVVAAPVRAGEVVRQRDLVTPGLVAGLGAGMRAVPVRLADDAAAALLHAGDRVDVLVASGGEGSAATAAVVADDLTVLVAPTASTTGSTSLLGAGSGSTGGSGAVLVLAASASQALDLTRAAATGRLAAVLRPG